VNSTIFSGALGLPGGGIFNDGTLTLTGCVISGNISGRGGFPPLGPPLFRGASGSGGGIYSEGRLTMNDCAVSNNTTPGGDGPPGDGGGIYSTGELSITGCAVSNNITGVNSSGNSIAAVGGGIYARGRTTITNSVVRDNRGGGHGGGVYNSGNMTAEDTTFSGNSTADGVPGGQNGFDGSIGGGIANFSVMTLTRCTVSGNRTGKGSVAQASGAQGGNGGSGGSGGGVLNSSLMVMTDSTVSNNVTGDGADARLGVVSNAGIGGSGGGVYNDGTLTVTNSVLRDNRTGIGGKSSEVNCSHGNGGDGGGIASPAGTLKLSQNTIILNQTGVSIEPCGRDGLGGGLYGAGKIRSTIVSNNFVRFQTSAREVVGTGAGFESLGYNYIGTSSGCCFTSTDRHGVNSAPGFNLHLDPVTLVPLLNSVALDAGLARDIDDQPVNTDKRGAARPFDFPAVPPQPGGDDSDIGAFERQSTDPPPTPTPTPTTVQFAASSYSVVEGCVQTEVMITRAGPKDGTTVANYVVTDFSIPGASQRGDFTYAEGTVTFAPGEDTQTVPVLINEDAYAEGTEDFIVFIVGVQGGQPGAPNPTVVHIMDNDTVDGADNPIDDNATFVCQHYHDFLSRQADDAGQAFWTNQLAACGSDAGCLDRKREDVSAAFFLSIEFQQTGYFAIRVNKAAFGNQPGNPRYLQFLRETQELGRDVVVGQPGFEALLDFNKQHYTEEFVARADFLAAHGGQNAGQYVDSLFAGAGATPTQAERNAAVSAFGTGDTTGRASALRSVVESGSVYNRLYNPAFVLMQYFAYLRRNPDAAPDNDFGGYNFWLAKLDRFTAPGEDARDESVALGRVRRAEMVRSFLLSVEYRGRFQGDPNRGS
jgi:hypothetical protein